MASDLEIARGASLEPIMDIAAEAGFAPQSVSPYGRYVAKIDQRAYEDKPLKAKLALVTAINPTPAGEGKTTVSVALADGMREIGKNAMLALREPSLGPVFGMKGGATGGGYAQVVPMESINLHFTGDLHAITAANNLLCAMVDNHIQQGNQLGIDPRRVCFRHCLDVNDRQLRQIVQGIGGTQNGTPREDGFDITAASEVMAIFCLAADLKDLKARLGRIVVARTYAGEPVTAAQVGAAGAMTALLRDAFSPNLIQTIGHTPCLMHGGPFANIAHGCNSVAATRLAMRMSDYTVTEAGFGADLGAEKFLDIKCRMNGLWPNVIVLVATVRALKHHGGAQKGTYGEPNEQALRAGMSNLMSHIQNIRDVWQTPVVVALNRFATDTEEELALVSNMLRQAGVPSAPCNGWAQGGKGAKELAALVCATADQNPAAEPHFTYPDEASLIEKIRAVAKRVYHAADVTFAPQAEKDLAQLEREGYAACPVCIAKTQYSMSDNPALLGAPEGYTLTIRSARLSAGAGFVVAFAGSIIAMPGLPKTPAALAIDVDEDGEIVGLF
ncbi:MAG: formate--tetrahydrofolate ligase [Clostridiales bacterium]|nr:formate--tetrahydrofolate ligase [Clostridiales bacterium]MDO4351399.1 formate--tetrahydrofolate ligase [Eubacteriales bacterium]MDY4008849.1 formate--tetrahydrofolate ligase [Candidatus Limiplasma sp.]